MRYYVTGYNDKYRDINSYYVGMRENKLLGAVMVPHFMPGFTYFSAALKRNGSIVERKVLQEIQGRPSLRGRMCPYAAQNALD